MYVAAIRIYNYRSILDSGWLTFTPGFNLVVGSNNVGKSSLLHCIGCRFIGEPHRSIETLPARDDLINLLSRVDISMVGSGEEIRRMVVNTGQGHKFFPWPRGLDLNELNNSAAFDRLFSAERVEFRVSAQAHEGNSPPGWSIPEYPATRAYDPLVEGDQYRMFVVDVDVPERRIRSAGLRANAQPNQDFGLPLGQLFAQRMYKFLAERMALGQCAFGVSTELAPDARNLAEVLITLQGNPARFNDYCNLVREVFPEVRKVSVRPQPTGGNIIEIMVWQVDPALEREDLAFPLSRCGTGIGQVLAILYVAKISEHPRTIIIDEPGSFLHPGAARALIGILKRFGHHQYIVATHSPEIISELADVPVTIVRWGGTKSIIEQAPRTTSAIASAVLTDIGARLSDVFGFDKVLWVEGQSDAQSIKELLVALNKPHRGLAILPVRDTGSFRRRSIAEVLAIYRTLSLGDALLPPAVLFLFDREGRSETDIADATREGRGKLMFLPRRMLESYLLNVEAITRLLNEIGEPYDIVISEELVNTWITEHGAQYCDVRDPPRPYSVEWLATVDSASLLSRLFSDLSDARLEYRKSVHTPRLTVLICELDREAAGHIADLVADAIE